MFRISLARSLSTRLKVARGTEYAEKESFTLVPMPLHRYPSQNVRGL
jgi:hypothetical protein